MRLWSSEWLRFRSRRLVKWLVILGIAGALVAVTIATLTSNPPSAERLARAEANHEREVRRCVKQDAYGDPQVEPDDVQATCERLFPLRDFLPGNQLALQELPEYLQGASFVVILLGLVAGASAVGASWQSGTITTILTWEPRRVRWFASRLLAVAVGVFVIAAVLLVVLGAGLAAGAALRGTTTIDEGWFGSVAGSIGRIGVVAAGVALIGAAVAMIGRNTAAALGGVFVYLVIVESIVRGFRPGLSRFMLGPAIGALITWANVDLSDGMTDTTVLTPASGTVVMAVFVAVLLAAAVVALRARDVN